MKCTGLLRKTDKCERFFRESRLGKQNKQCSNQMLVQKGQTLDQKCTKIHCIHMTYSGRLIPQRQMYNYVQNSQKIFTISPLSINRPISIKNHPLTTSCECSCFCVFLNKRLTFLYEHCCQLLPIWLRSFVRSKQKK